MITLTVKGGKMKFIHVSDLHLGKRVHEYSMMEDQRHILGEILKAIDAERPDALLIAGDVYDRAVPSEEAVTAFGDFLTEVSDRGCKTYIIAGNHDSGARLDFCCSILRKSGIHIAGAFNGRMERIETSDGFGKLNIWMLPYFRVSEVRAAAGRPIETYTDAMNWILETSRIDGDERNLLIAHQFFTGTSGELILSESEDQKHEVGGLQDISESCLDAFDYVALGHLHVPQKVVRDTVRYCGSPLKYSKSECLEEKSITVVDVKGKDDVDISTIPLVPLRDMRIVRGRLEDILEAAPEDASERNDYMFAELTEHSTRIDELYDKYPNMMRVEIIYSDGAGSSGDLERSIIESESPAQLFSRFYKDMTGEDLSSYQMKLLMSCIDAREGAE